MAASLCAAPPVTTSSSCASSCAGQSSTRSLALPLQRVPPTCDEEAVATTLLSELADIATSPQSPLMKAISAWPEFSSVASNSIASAGKVQCSSSAYGAALRCFLRGTLLMVADGQWRPAEDLKALYAAEGANSQSERVVGLRLLRAVLGHSDADRDGERAASRVIATFESVADGRRLVADCDRAHPFLVEAKGWASLEPAAASRNYGLTCQPLSLGDVCVPPASSVDRMSFKNESGVDRSSCDCETISEADSSAAWLLSQLALGTGLSQDRQTSNDHVLTSRQGRSRNGSFEKKRPNKSKKTSEGSARTDDPPSKRPMNAFMLFAQRYRQQVTKEHPGRDNRAISTILGDHWRQLDHAERVQFVVEARALAEEHQKLYPNCWKRKRPAQHHEVKRST